MKKKQEYLPWYRRKGFKGDFSELEKRELDRIRSKKKHPAKLMDDLPDEVRDVLMDLDSELQDQKESELYRGAFALFWIIIAALYYGYSDHDTYPIQAYVIGVLCFLILSLVVFWERRKIKREHRAFDKNGWPSSIDERIMENWEINYIVEIKRD